jgi:hypothetical protein
VGAVAVHGDVDVGIDPAAERTATTWSTFLRSQAGALPTCDFFEPSTLSGARLYALAVIEHASRPILCRSRSHRCWSSGVSVLVEDAAQDAGAVQSVGVEVVYRDGVLLSFGR